MNKKVDKKILISSTDVMMIQFLVPHVLYLNELGYQVDVACSCAEGYQNEGYEQKIKGKLPDNSTFYPVRTERNPFSLQNIKGYRDLEQIINSKKFDLVWTNEPVMGVMTRLASRKFRRNGGKVMYMAHGYHFFKGAPKRNWLYYPIEKIMSSMCDAITVINWEDYYFTQKHFRVPVFHIDGIGLNIKKYDRVDVNVENKRRQLNINMDDILILSVGELQNRKNHRVIIEALGQINNPKLKYIVCGRGELLEEYKELCHKLKIEDNVQFLGHRYDIDEILAVSDIFAHPSQREGLGIAAIEAMASGLPLITSNVQGIKDYVKDGINGYSFEPYDVEGYKRAIEVLSNDKEQRIKIGLVNKESAKKYDIKQSCVSVEKIIRELV